MSFVRGLTCKECGTAYPVTARMICDECFGPVEVSYDYAAMRGVQFVNHTFTTHLALSASLQPCAGRERDDLCEYPFEPSALARDFTTMKLLPDSHGLIHLPERPGLGLEPDLAALKKYLVGVEIKVAGRKIFSSQR